MTALATPGLCLVTDLRQFSSRRLTIAGDAWDTWLTLAIAAGVNVIQVREPHLDSRRLVELVRAVVAIAQPFGASVVVNDRVDAALAAGAHGVHLRSDGPSIARVRTLGPAGWIVGRSVHSIAEVAAHESADYLLFGTVFASTSKPSGAPVQGPEALRAAVQATRTPVWAIGGIDVARAQAVVATGAAGIAAIGAFLPDPDGVPVATRVHDLAAAIGRRG